MSSNFTQAIMARLERVISKEEGSRWLWEQSDHFSDALAITLEVEADRLRQAGDESGGDEYQAWANEVRGTVTRDLIFGTDPASPEEAQAILAEHRHRFDDAFIEQCVEMAGQPIARLRSLVEEGLEGAPEELLQISAVIEDAGRELGFLQLVSSPTDHPAHLSQVLLLRGTFLLLRAQVGEQQGREAEADDLRREATALLTQCSDLTEAPELFRAQAEGNLAVLAGLDRPEDVATHQQAALRLAEAAGDVDMMRSVRRDLAYWAKKKGDVPAALELYRLNIEATERALFEAGSPILWADVVAATQPDYDGAVETCLELAAHDSSYAPQALELAETGKARAFLRSLATIASGGRRLPPRLTRRRQEILRRMTALSTTLAQLPAEMAEKQSRQIHALQQTLGTTEAQLATHRTSVALDLQCVPCSFSKMCAVVPRNGIVLSYYSLPERVVLFALDREGLAAPPVEIALSSHDLARVTVNIDLTLRIRQDYRVHDQLQRQADQKVDYFWPTHNLHFLYEKLIAPVASVIEGKSLVYVIPHGCLRDLPFHALLEPDGSALVDRVAVAYAPSLAVLRRCQDRSRPDLANCFAAGVGSDQSGPPTAEAEAAAVARLFESMPHPATRDALLGGSVEADLIHLACHSDVGSPWTSFRGLALEDGVFYQQEIAALRLRASLVSLSACETARSDLLPRPGHEMAGLVGAFVRAGVPSVLASRWPLADRVSQPFFEIFYNRLRDGQNKAEALRAAQRALKSEPRYQHPYYWAPLSLWGAI